MVPPTPAHQMNYTLVPSGSEGDEEDENAFNAMLEPDNSNIMDNGIAVRISDDDGDDDLVPPPLDTQVEPAQPERERSPEPEPEPEIEPEPECIKKTRGKRKAKNTTITTPKKPAKERQTGPNIKYTKRTGK